jgi:anti-sigma B factor antagonist
VAKLTDFGLRDEPVDEKTHLVEPAGEIDSLTAPQLGSRLLGLADDGKTGVVVDLSRVTFIDSTAIGVILNGLRALAARSGRLVLVCPTERTRRPFEVTGLIHKLPIAYSVEDALGSLGAA